MRSFGSLHEASILSVLLLSKEIGRYLAAISPPSALVARPAKVSHRPASRPAGLSFSVLFVIRFSAINVVATAWGRLCGPDHQDFRERHRPRPASRLTGFQQPAKKVVGRQ